MSVLRTKRKRNIKHTRVLIYHQRIFSMELQYCELKWYHHISQEFLENIKLI
jgi:hypothetical protein